MFINIVLLLLAKTVFIAQFYFDFEYEVKLKFSLISFIRPRGGERLCCPQQPT